MKTSLSATLLFFLLPNHWRTPLVVPLLCLRPQKNQPLLAGSPFLTPPLHLLHGSSPAALPLHTLNSPSSPLLKLQVASNPA
jgi:hypothetical protein